MENETKISDLATWDSQNKKFILKINLSLYNRRTGLKIPDSLRIKPRRISALFGVYPELNFGLYPASIHVLCS